MECYSIGIGILQELFFPEKNYLIKTIALKSIFRKDYTKKNVFSEGVGGKIWNAEFQKIFSQKIWKNLKKIINQKKGQITIVLSIMFHRTIKYIKTY